MNLTNQYELKNSRDKFRKQMKSPIFQCIGMVLCPLLLTLGCIVNTSSKIIDSIRTNRKTVKRRTSKKNKHKTIPKNKNIVDDLIVSE